MRPGAPGRTFQPSAGNLAPIDLWGGSLSPFIITESRSLHGVLRVVKIRCGYGNVP
jgi:hypothetical protein